MTRYRTVCLIVHSIGHGTLSSGITIKYKTNEQATVVCDEGYQLKHNSNNKIVCRQVMVPGTLQYTR
jgi:Sushi repeat (SCR repeat)